MQRLRGLPLGQNFWLFVLLASLAFVVLPSPLSAAAENNDNVDICPGVNEAKVDQVDILILLDNSRSLGQTERPSDVERRRFDALRIFFDSVAEGLKNPVGSGTRVKVDVSLMPFAQTTKFGVSDEDTIRLSADMSDPAALANEISDALPDATQRPGTNFINALNAAATFMESKQASSCKFLIWFTDGAFDYSPESRDKKLTEKDKKQIKEERLKELETLTCDENGWASRLRRSGVNTYVVLLGQLDVLRRDNPETFPPSLSLMTQITGDRSTGEIGNIGFCRDAKPTVVGEIFTVGSKEIGKLTPVFQRIGFAIGGGQDIYCPTPEESVVTRGLPDLKFFKSISLISLDLERLPILSEIDVVTPDGALREGADFFESQSSETLSQIDLMPKAVTLGSGWKLSLDAKQGFCIMAKFIDPPTVKITKSGSNQAVVKSEDGVLTQAEVDRIKYRDGEKVTTPDEIMGNFDAINAGYISGLSGQLNIEADPDDSPVFKEPLTVIVLVDKPIPDFGSCLEPFVFKSDRLPTSGDTPKDRNFPTATCTVVTKGLPSSTSLDIEIKTLVSELKAIAGCELIKTSLVVDGKNQGTKYSVPLDVEQAIALNFEVAEKNTSCDLKNFAGVQFVYGEIETTESSLVSVSFNFRAPPNPLWVIVATLAILIIAIILSLFLLRYISSLLAVMPNKDKTYSYEAEIEISQSSFGQVSILINGIEASKFQPSAADMKLPKKSSSQSTLELQEIKLIRKLGGFLRPFADPKAIVEGNDQVAYWQQASGGGLSIPFRKAIIVSSLKDVTKRSVDSTKLNAHLSLIVSNIGSGGGIEGIRSLILSQNLKDVCKEFRDKSLSSEEDNAKKESATLIGSQSSREMSKPPVAGPPPPKPSVPPPPPPK